METRHHADPVHQADFKLVVSFLRGEHMNLLSSHQAIEVWGLADGFGDIGTAGLYEIEFDWSHVRDSSKEAMAAMAQKIRDTLAERAHPGKQFCVLCLDTGLHLFVPEKKKTYALEVRRPDGDWVRSGVPYEMESEAIAAEITTRTVNGLAPDTIRVVPVEVP